MARMGTVLIAVVGGVAGLMLAGSASANLVSNGTFDTGTAGWTLSQTDGFTWSPTEGNPGGALILNNGPGLVPQASQDITGLSIGTEYQISLDGKTHYNCCNSSTTPGAGVSIDGNQFDFLINNGQPWTPYTFNFTYDGGANTLTLSSQRNGTDSDGEFDNVSMVALSAPTSTVPLPPTIALVAIGLAALGIQKRKQA